MSWTKTILASMWVGWSRDLRWTNPFLGLGLKTIAPISSVLTVTIIYSLGSVFGGTYSPATLAYVLVGSALYAHVANYSSTPNLAVSESKWNYVFPHIFISPNATSAYIAGRTLANFFTSALTTLVALIAVSLVMLDVFGRSFSLIVTPSSVALVAVALILNIPASLGLGYMLASYSLLASKFEWALSSYISGLLMVFSGALFPVSILPWPLSAAANILPFTEFIRAAREALIYGSLWSYASFLAYDVLGGVVMLFLGLQIFKMGQNRGRKLGIIDKKIA